MIMDQGGRQGNYLGTSNHVAHRLLFSFGRAVSKGVGASKVSKKFIDMMGIKSRRE